MIVSLQKDLYYLNYLQSIPEDLKETIEIVKFPFISEENLLDDWIANSKIDGILEEIILKRKLFKKLDYLYKFISLYDEISCFKLSNMIEPQNKLSSFVYFDIECLIDLDVLKQKKYFTEFSNFFNECLVDNILKINFARENKNYNLIECYSDEDIVLLSPYNEDMIRDGILTFDREIVSFLKNYDFANNLSKLQNDEEYVFDFKFDLNSIKDLIYFNLSPNGELFDKYEFDKFLNTNEKKKNIII